MNVWKRWKEIRSIHEDKYPEFRPWFQFVTGMAIGSVVIVPIAIWMLYHVISHHGLLENIIRYFMQ
jgi:hypothetical protein